MPVPPFYRLLPHPSLRGVIDSYWVIRQKTDPVGVYPMLPMGYPFLEFSLNENQLLLHRGQQTEPFRHIAIGLTGKPLYFQNTGFISSVLIRLHPWGLARLFAGSGELSASCNAGLIFSDRLEYLIRDLSADQEQVHYQELLDRFFRRFLRQREVALDARIPIAIRRILQHKGNLSISDLGEQLFLSQRRLEQLFKAHLGLTPKAYADIARFQSALAATGNYRNLTELALDAGYYDQSHFIRHFKKYAGVPPSEILRPDGTKPEKISNLYNPAF
ncbi:helix-turn-helix transcriptional regulator [Flavilitoribacter nigricans]|uniref:helix-turn-helix transcriptional regulator n=1 Tax=Flavilitoribacter nigricans TaxID=70997 RepID=UPI001179CE6B|nr:helix-turn-helix transcriptional regulator [Flavilitoribacter nigricans]